MDVEKLISEVFTRGSLWDQRDKNHHNRFILDKLWDEMAVELHTTRVTARNKWKTLRDKFRTTPASISKPRSGDEGTPSYKSQWTYFENLLFLRDQFIPRPSSGNLTVTDEQRSSCFQTVQETEETEDNMDSQINVSSHFEESVPISNENYADQNSQHSTRPSSSSSPGNPPQIIANTRNERRFKDGIGSPLLEIEKKKK